jgi:GTPase involved in cell partitioning and DNA repair
VDNARAIEIIRGGQGAEQDHAKARELVHLIRNIRATSAHPSDQEAVQAELTALDEELWAQATWLVERHADMIVGLACNLANRVQATKQKVVWLGSEIDSLPSVVEFLSTLPPAAYGPTDT